MNDTLEYPYKANPRAMFLAMAFFGACAAMMARAALTNDRGLIINGVITLETVGATRFYWCVAAVSLLFVAGGMAGLIAGRRSPRSVRLTATELSAPKHGFARQPTVIPLSEIQNVGMMTMHRQRMLTIHHARGSLTVTQSMLPGADAFDQLHDTLISRLQHRDSVPHAAVR
jgi:hypothetical protein